MAPCALGSAVGPLDNQSVMQGLELGPWGRTSGGEIVAEKEGGGCGNNLTSTTIS